MSEETKMILNEIHALRTEMLGMNQRMDGMEGSLNQRVEKMGESLNQRMDGMEGSLNQRVEEMGESLNQRIDAVQEETTRTRLLLENEISRKIDIIGEGHDFLKQRLDEALQMEKKRERMELEILNLQIDMKKVKTCLHLF